MPQTYDSAPGGTRTHDPRLRRPVCLAAPAHTGSQPIATADESESSHFHPLHRKTPNTKSFAAPVLQGIESAPRADAVGLMTVGQVAAHLGVSTFTVYGLCDRGELAHVRVSNAIRILPSSLRAFIERGR